VFYSLQKLKEIKKDLAFNFIVTASGMSHLAIPGYSLYSATKFALKGYADAYRYELSEGQHLSLVYPVATYTKFFDVANSEKMPWPRQKSITVAKAMIKGAEKGKKHIYPSFLFRFGLLLNSIVPIFTIYNILEGNKFRKAQIKQS
jgi:short-subunit dehydrogenase